MSEDLNRYYQTQWYKRQKNNGIIYLITLPCGNTYVGITTNSLTKRLCQHRAHKSLIGALARTYEIKDIKIEVLERVNSKTMPDRKAYWINKLSPSINKRQTVAEKARSKGSYKGGVVYKEKWYPTKIAVWREHSRVPLGTFKSRLNRGLSLEEALK